jgi:branched-chain amino acid transport system substrate-binding protein
MNKNSGSLGMHKDNRNLKIMNVKNPGRILSLLFLGLAGATSLAQAAPAVVKVGVLLSRTGGMADIGTEGEHGFELAIKNLKTKLDTEQYKVQFIFEDSRSAPDLAATAINKLIKIDHVDMILGDLTSTATLAAAPLAQSAKIPMLTPSSTSDKVTQVGDYIFRACYIDSFQGLAMANYAIDSLKAKTAALLVDMDMDHSRDVSKVFATEFQKRGGKLLKTVTFSGSHDTSYVPQLTELRNLQADVIYAPVYYAKMGVIFKQAKSFQVKSQMLGTDAWDSPQLFKLASGTTAGALLTDPFSYQNPAQNVQDFRTAFKSKYDMEPSSYAALAYDSVFVMESALSKIKWPVKADALPKSIRDQLAQTKNVEGVTGKITLDKNRNVGKPDIVILKLTDRGYDYHATYSGAK